MPTMVYLVSSRRSKVFRQVDGWNQSCKFQRMRNLIVPKKTQTVVTQKSVHNVSVAIVLCIKQVSTLR